MFIMRVESRESTREGELSWWVLHVCNGVEGVSGVWGVMSGGGVFVVGCIWWLLVSTILIQLLGIGPSLLPPPPLLLLLMMNCLS